MSTEASENKAETEETAVSDQHPKQKKRKNKKRKNRSKDKDKFTLNNVSRWFAACPRCSYFLTGYRNESGRAKLEEALENSGQKWLNLDWNETIRHLVHKSYGGRFDIDYYHFDGTCIECQRHYVYHAAEDAAPEFRIEFKPRSRL